MKRELKFKADLATTAMGIMPHDNVDRALDLALAMDIPFWPQLPKISYCEDMYVQALEQFPGIVIDAKRSKIFLDTKAFVGALPQFLEHEDDPAYFVISNRFSHVYRRFLEKDLSRYRSVRGQVISPVSLALKIVDENDRPIVYNDEIRDIIFSFIQKKANAQYRELCAENERAFVWVDDPGLEFIFSALCGYDSARAKKELGLFFGGIEGIRGVHLCGRPDWDFLLTLDIEIISFNAYAFGDTFVAYDKVKAFLEEGGVVSWGIVPTCQEEFTREDLLHLAKRLENMWGVLQEKGLDIDIIIKNSLLAPATCNLVNQDGAETVEKSFELLTELSHYLKERYLS
ncbi:MAG TPA: hypothetical protein VMT62_11005 [Syntrophorhabdaceae bacterium]|nr:hypothetical protein [Syntrophorhabdaceae bacterium]